MQSDEQIAKSLLNFAVNNPDLSKLESMLREFNPFRILGISDFEIRHSNVLAWLLEPHAHHGFGDELFKNLLLEILKGDDEARADARVSGVIGADFSDLKVFREWRNIDVLAISHGNKLALIIENKLNSAEMENQLNKYEQVVEKQYPGYKKVYVYLTLDGESPKGSNKFIAFSHRQVLGIVRTTTEIRKDYLNTKVYEFVQQYLHILEEKTMQNQEIIDICTKLYIEHKDAIDMILKHGKPALPHGVY